jgi:hypothetical protein
VKAQRWRSRVPTRCTYALAAAAIAVLTLGWPPPAVVLGGPDPFGLGRSSPPEGPAVLSGISTGLIWTSHSLPPTTLTLHNVRDRSADCRVWWILAKQGDPKPWESPVMESTPVSVKLGPLASRTVGVNVVAIFSSKPGLFRLSGWAHCRNPLTQTWSPSDGVTMNGAIEVLDASPTLKQSPANSRFLFVYGAATEGTFAEGRPAEIRVKLANASVQPRTVEVFCYLAPPAVSRPWTSLPSSRCQSAEVNLPAAALTVLKMNIPNLPRPGRYELSIWLHEQQAGLSVPVDGVRLRTSVTVNE